MAFKLEAVLKRNTVNEKFRKQHIAGDILSVLDA